MLFKFMSNEPLGINRTLSIHPKILLATLRKNQEKGFTILEVLVTILVISGFLLGSLQATVLAVFLRIQAQDKQEAANWIQQDLELIRYQAFILDGGVAVSATCTSGYASALNTAIGSITNPVVINNKNYSVTRTPTSNSNILTINYTVAYASTHPRFKSVSGADNTVTTLSTEVIPNAALSC